MPRLAETVRWKTASPPLPWNTENTSVVAPPMSTPSTERWSRRARRSIMRPTAAGVGMTGTGDQLMSRR